MKNNVVQRRSQIAVLAIATLFSGYSRADITGAQVDALAQHTVMQFKEIVVSTLSACASAYPDTRGDAVGTMEILVPNLKRKPEFADKWIASIGQCMDKERVLTRTQCGTLQSKIQGDKISLDDKDLKPILGEALAMLQPCIPKEN